MKILLDDQIQVIRGWIDEDCSLTLVTIRAVILWEMSEDVCESTMNNYIKSSLRLQEGSENSEYKENVFYIFSMI